MIRPSRLAALPLLLLALVGCGPCTSELPVAPPATPLPPPPSADSERPSYERRDLGEAPYLYIEGKSRAETFATDLVEGVAAVRAGAAAAGLTLAGDPFALARGDWETGTVVRFAVPLAAMPSSALPKPLQATRLRGGDSIALRFEGPIARLPKADAMLALARENDGVTSRNDARIYWFPTLPATPDATIALVIEQAVGDPDDVP